MEENGVLENTAQVSGEENRFISNLLATRVEGVEVGPYSTYSGVEKRSNFEAAPGASHRTNNLADAAPNVWSSPAASKINNNLSGAHKTIHKDGMQEYFDGHNGGKGS